jgi:hypothetical protein
VNINIKKFWNQGVTRKIAGGLLAVLAVSGVASAQQKKDEISFDLIPNPAVINCLRANSNEEPRAKATVIRGKLNDTLILDLDGIKPGLDFDLFTVQHSPFFADGSKDPSFNGSFGLAWYQSDIEVGKRTDDGHVRIKTILLDQIFGFDPDVKLPPTNTFQVGFWFNNPVRIRSDQTDAVQWRTQSRSFRDDQRLRPEHEIGSALHRSKRLSNASQLQPLVTPTKRARRASLLRCPPTRKAFGVSGTIY